MSQQLDHLHKEILDLVNGLMPIDSSAFYFVDKHMNARGIALNGVTQEKDKAYRDKYLDLDLAAPRHFESSTENVVILEKLYKDTNWRSSVYYQEFLAPMNMEHVADMFFRDAKGNIVAVLTMLRSNTSPPFSEQELIVMKSIHQFVQFTLKTYFLPLQAQFKQVAKEEYALTDREMDVLEYVTKGMDNNEIAQTLAVSLATVKTHINHIYRKTEVINRTQLLIKFAAMWAIK
ncbi:helix-turn-helix transcriptional regulator [Vibrio sp. SCSIO 43136]|uniref:response regulator transcription factor n=1 Tax=Vibrio sp. SCSIO 43136 TaxID=2819101 RepID=UPI0020751AAB|nr:helix-turn-helix transcriptional regulator [Vibrio sp. SCSIO 43136]USD67431.1 hypothetical protein J4N39_22655 [Vibrio sp. SCSIO 43136]